MKNAKERICFIGGGNMGEAIIKGLVKQNLCEPKNVFLYEIDKSKHEKFKKLSINVVETAKAGIESSDFVLLALKPNVIRGFLEENKDILFGKI